MADNMHPRARQPFSAKTLFISLLSAAPSLVAAQCISLQGSSHCRAFQSASVSKSSRVINFFPFLQFVSDVGSFDQQLAAYVQTTYVQEKYQGRFGCDNVDLTNTSELYARFTTTVVCNGIVQNSIEDCQLSSEDSEPVCTDTCADFAESVALVSTDTEFCPNPNDDVNDLIRAEFTTCNLPDASLDGRRCVRGIENEPENCGYGNSTLGLCSYCASGGINSTDTCCFTSNADQRCEGIQLPSIFPTMSFPSATASASPEPSASGLAGGAIAGIVIGSVVGALLLLGLLIFCCIRMRRGNGNQEDSILNQPSPPRTGVSQTQNAPAQTAPKGFEVLPGGRIARMSALEGHSGDSASRNGAGGATTSAGAGAGAGAAAAAAAYAANRRRGDNNSSSEEYRDSPESETRTGVLRPPPTNIRRHGSLSSGSAHDPHSPTSAGGMSSPPGVASQQSEQLPFFKDYYSQDDIHPGDLVAVLWAYQPRAGDEFALERGDMLKVVGIWDDGWATGVMLEDRADEWEARRQAQRDSGVSHTSGRRDPSPPAGGEIKAFPLVCVCLPEHWRKTIEGDGSTETASSHHPLGGP